ncbi:MAG: PDZ domain-containing protein [Actinomycetales bacterium]|nr:PDZ domain-containing protein [Actinomycetales bacterium]
MNEREREESLERAEAMSRGAWVDDDDPRLGRPYVEWAVVRVRIGWALLLAAIVGLVLLGISPTPYVVERPGPAYDALGDAPTTEGESAPVIAIDGATTYPTDGELDLLTVNVAGSPTQTLDWFQVLQAWVDPSQAIAPVDLLFPGDASEQDVDEQNAALMRDSQQSAVAAALGALGIDYGVTVEVGSVAAGSAAEGVLETGDRLLEVGGRAIRFDTDVRAAVEANGAGTPMTIRVLRGGAPLELEVTPTLVGGRPLLGIGVTAQYDFPFDVEVRLDDVGGPSAGQIFALGIYDKLTPGALLGGAHVAGAGTIAADGEVGAIGGIVQKMYGAQRAGAEWFLAPRSNCDEVVGNVPAGLRVVAVDTLDDSIAALEAIGQGGDTSVLPSCG